MLVRFEVRVLVWATTFGADLWSFTRFLDRHADVQLKVVLDRSDLFRSQFVAKEFPLRAELVERKKRHAYVGLLGFRPDVTILDNWIPRRRLSPSAMMLWHGFGWGAGTDASGFATLHRQLKRTWGDVRTQNARFRWQCFGSTDFEYRTQKSEISAENCRVLGAASHDDLRTPIERARLQPAYPFDIVNKKTVLLAPTWAYGGFLHQWGDELQLFERLVDKVRDHGANLLIRMHDRFRFEPEYRDRLESVVAGSDNVMLKYKDTAPDNYLDLQIADVLITNFSSIANLYYATGRPSIHIAPTETDDDELIYHSLRAGGRLEQTKSTIRDSWKMPPSENGGLLARTFDDLMLHIDRALEEPGCCESAARSFIEKHMVPADGRCCERTFAALEEVAPIR